MVASAPRLRIMPASSHDDVLQLLLHAPHPRRKPTLTRVGAEQLRLGASGLSGVSATITNVAPSTIGGLLDGYQQSGIFAPSTATS
ncbi:uncharacterized protein ATNIH1004_001955 [Aspergillus tanneri]|uniref:Uncharacterized protein n=1 Tax=Aspergillus tanneri TaxID=1220188 RepID=A0A5M9M7M0_9EURO|nr:uncharacterized protein ATNIH1004_001955 [Aspergillus tanneri]KAA8641490.1 hypothetical protein ATNIH1004_001955 [Aspergillus tanneri]